MTEANVTWTDDGIVVIAIQGRLDLPHTSMLTDAFNRLLETGACRMVVDLSQIHVVDTEGDYPLLHLRRRIHELGGRLRLVCPPGNPLRVFYELMHLDVLFEIDDSLETALRAMRTAPEK